jgi:hypothetical protein
MVFYNTTTREDAEAILREGFRDGPPYPELLDICGVWLSDIPLDCNEGAKGDVVLEVTVSLSAEDLSLFELIEEGKPYREWCVPAGRLNGVAGVRMVAKRPRIGIRRPATPKKALRGTRKPARRSPPPADSKSY